MVRLGTKRGDRGGRGAPWELLDSPRSPRSPRLRFLGLSWRLRSFIFRAQSRKMAVLLSLKILAARDENLRPQTILTGGRRARREITLRLPLRNSAPSCKIWI